jgi:hypothetical protein
VWLVAREERQEGEPHPTKVNTLLANINTQLTNIKQLSNINTRLTNVNMVSLPVVEHIIFTDNFTVPGTLVQSPVSSLLHQSFLYSHHIVYIYGPIGVAYNFNCGHYVAYLKNQKTTTVRGG